MRKWEYFSFTPKKNLPDFFFPPSLPSLRRIVFEGWIKNIFLSCNVFSFVFLQAEKHFLSVFLMWGTKWFPHQEIIFLLVWDYFFCRVKPREIFFSRRKKILFSLVCFLFVGRAVLVCTLGLLLCLGWAATICWGFLAAGHCIGTLKISFAPSRFKISLSPMLQTKDKMFRFRFEFISTSALSTFSWSLDLWM